MKKAHTFQRTIGANTVEDQVVLAGLPYLPVYTVATSPVAATVANSHVLQIMAGSSLNLYILGIDVWQFSSATTAAWIDWRLFRLTTAGTGGSAYTPQPFNTADAAAGATAMTLPSAKGTETTNLWAGASYFVQTPGAAGFQPLPVFTWKADLSNLIAPIRIAAGTANGLALKCVTGVVANVIVTATFVEASF